MKNLKNLTLILAAAFLICACEPISLEEYQAGKEAPKTGAAKESVTAPAKSSAPVILTESDFLPENPENPSDFSEDGTDTRPARRNIDFNNLTATLTDKTMISSPYGLCFDLTDGMLIYEKGGLDSPIHPVGVPKLLTALVTIDSLPADFVFAVGTELSLPEAGSSSAGLKSGQKLDMDGALTALLVPNGNDAAYMIAVNVAREKTGDYNLTDKEAVSYFVKLMNNYAKGLGCAASDFRNPDGNEAQGQISSMRDLLIISAAAADNPLIASICGKSSAKITFKTGEVAEWAGKLPAMPNSGFTPLGLKAGLTDQSGYCFTGLFQLEELSGKRFITTVAGADSTAIRDSDTDKMLKAAISQ
ncbi:hypothetical protein FACS189499_03130 [Clostridia bacterium]|nr:hypothetical protein FACS189499_03130 [Clostridia bacterium]